MEVCTTLCSFCLYFKLGKLLELGALCHGLHHCSNGDIAHWLATMFTTLEFKWRLCFLDRVLTFGFVLAQSGCKPCHEWHVPFPTTVIVLK